MVSAVLSPILFTVYIDEELEKKGVGCYWNQHFAGAVCYADPSLVPCDYAQHVHLHHIV